MKTELIKIKKKIIQTARSTRPFKSAIEELKEQGYKIIPVEENAKLRIETGKNSFISKWGNYVKEGIIYIPNQGRFLTKNSPVLNNLTEAIKIYKKWYELCITGKQELMPLKKLIKVPYSLHIADKQATFYIADKQALINLENSIKVPYNLNKIYTNKFYITDRQAGRALGNSIKVPYNLNEIFTDRFGEEEITAFLFGEIAKDYGLFLKEAGINKMSLDLNNRDYINKQKIPFANQLWFGSLDFGAFLNGMNNCLNCGDGVRGVKAV